MKQFPVSLVFSGCATNVLKTVTSKSRYILKQNFCVFVNFVYNIVITTVITLICLHAAKQHAHSLNGVGYVSTVVCP